MRPITTLLALAALLAAVVAAPGAHGQAKPAPGCFPLFADKKGDVEDAQLDITGWWFSFENGKAFAHMQVADLKAELPSEATGIAWYMLWGFDDAQRFVTASYEVGDLEPQFNYGTVNGSIREQAGDTPGSFNAGPDGVISIEIPADVGGSSGAKLSAPLADTAKLLGVPGVASAIEEIDTASGKAWTVGPCGSAPPATGGGTPTPPPSQTTPPPGSGPAKGQLDVKVSSRVPRAKKVKRSLSLTASSSKGITDVDAVLFERKAGGRVAGKGSAASLKGKRKLKLRISRKIKKGKYVLYLVGRNADGTSADRQFNLRFK